MKNIRRAGVHGDSNHEKENKKAMPMHSVNYAVIKNI
jgi:hypothetical protein